MNLLRVVAPVGFGTDTDGTPGEACASDGAHASQLAAAVVYGANSS